MLANQFAVGLKQEIKIKVAGAEGTFEQLLSKAKFEEAKLRDIGNSNYVVPMKRQASLSRDGKPDQTCTNNNQKR